MWGSMYLVSIRISETLSTSVSTMIVQMLQNTWNRSLRWISNELKKNDELGCGDIGIGFSVYKENNSISEENVKTWVVEK